MELALTAVTSAPQHAEAYELRALRMFWQAKWLMPQWR
jgi:hypothetical protein